MKKSNFIVSGKIVEPRANSAQIKAMPKALTNKSCSVGAITEGTCKAFKQLCEEKGWAPMYIDMKVYGAIVDDEVKEFLSHVRDLL